MSRISQRAKLELSIEQLTELKEIAQSRSAPHREVQRARILWLYSEGMGFTEISREVRMARKNVYKCVDKALAMGVKSALTDLARPGKVPKISEEARTWVRHLACVKPKELGYAAELWTRQALATHVRKHSVAQGYPALARAAKATAQRILSEAEIRPDKIRYYLERRDPDFIPKMKEVLVVYREVALAAADGVKNAEGKTVYTVSADEKAGIQALATVAPDLPPVEENIPPLLAIMNTSAWAPHQFWQRWISRPVMLSAEWNADIAVVNSSRCSNNSTSTTPPMRSFASFWTTTPPTSPRRHGPTWPLGPTAFATSTRLPMAPDSTWLKLFSVRWPAPS